MAIKKAFQPLHEALTALPQNTTVKAILENTAILALMTAQKGGFTGEDSFIEIDNKKVARKCAMLHAYFAHDNTDKTASFFYKNGSYMIGGEVLKANARKQWELDREQEAQELEDEMMEGNISPKEWKEQATTLNAQEFSWTITDEDKAQLIADFDGYETEEAFTEAYTAEAVPPFTDYDEQIKALRALAPKRVEEPAEDEDEDEATA